MLTPFQAPLDVKLLMFLVQLCDSIVAQMEDAETREFEPSNSHSEGLYLQSSNLSHSVLVKEVHRLHATNEFVTLTLQYW